MAPAVPVTRLAVANCVLAAGFSTKTQVSAISGRGVGMDAVRHIIADLGGDIHLDIPGASDPFTPDEPLTPIAFGICIRLPKSRWACV